MTEAEKLQFFKSTMRWAASGIRHRAFMYEGMNNTLANEDLSIADVFDVYATATRLPSDLK